MSNMNQKFNKNKKNQISRKRVISSLETNDETHLKGEEEDLEEPNDDYESNNQYS